MPVKGLGEYDDQNVFARILRGEIPCRKVYEDEWALAFDDIAPQAPVHVLVIPRGRFISIADFAAAASDAEIVGFWRAVGRVAKQLGLEDQGHVGNLVQKNRAAVPLLDAPGLLPLRAGECAFFVAEQLAFQKCFGNRRAVDADVRRPVPAA